MISYAYEHPELTFLMSCSLALVVIMTMIKNFIDRIIDRMFSKDAPTPRVDIVDRELVRRHDDDLPDIPGPPGWTFASYPIVSV